ncbi:MAG: aminotransferase class V-fold PLP-dependent enzyme [Sphingomonas sp.]
MTLDRRALLTAAAALSIDGRAFASPAAQQAAAPDDAHDWVAVAANYDVTREVIQLENGNWGMMARPVLDAYTRALARVNRDTSYYARRGMAGDLSAARDRLAAALGVSREEIAFTRNATEALKTLIGGYNRLRPGDRLLIADLDYDSTQAAFEGVGRRCGTEVVRIALPEPATHQSLIDAYAAAFDADRRIRLVLLTHLGHRTGLVIPVREIVALARSRGIDAIVDAAHSWGQLDFSLPDLDADFVGLNLHKWAGAPLGVGAIYIRRGRVADIDMDIANAAPDPMTVESRVHTGTVDYAAQLSVPVALAFQQAIGAPARAARLRHLRDRWAEALRGMDGLDVLTPADPRLYGGITSFRIRGLESEADNRGVAAALLERFRIFTVHRAGVARGACVRVTPALFTTSGDVDALAAALKQLVPQLRR